MEIRSLVPALLAGLVLAALGCAERDAGGAPADRDTGTATPAAATSQAAADWCAAHGVPESVCTLCNPALVPAFQARGDWCAEHGLPESYCPACKSPGSVAQGAAIGEEAPPADGTRVRFRSLETARHAGLELAEASTRPSRSEVEVTARIVYDATMRAEVNARAAGVVRQIHADIGARVQPGAPLATIESAAVGAEQSRLQVARSRVEIAEKDHARLVELHERGLAAERELLVVAQELDAARADLSAAEAALRMVGASGDGAAQYTLTAPIAGTVTGRNATIGRLVDTEQILFEIARTSKMWAEIDIPESETARVPLGQSVCLTVDGLAGREFCGVLSYVASEIDSHTRTTMGRISLANPDGLLRANMFARGRIALAESGASILLPRSAVQQARGASIVFVRLAEDLYEARHVRVGSSDGDRVEVAGRIAPGDEIVTVGSFLLKTETLKGSIGAGCCEVEDGR